MLYQKIFKESGQTVIDLFQQLQPFYRLPAKTDDLVRAIADSSGEDETSVNKLLSKRGLI